MIRQGLKFSLGAALLTSFFWHRGNVLDNFVYPVFGYVSVLIEPSMGGAIAAGLGRLGGSALGGIIAAILVNAYGIQVSSFFVIPSLTYILAALICETYRWQAAYFSDFFLLTFPPVLLPYTYRSHGDFGWSYY